MNGKTLALLSAVFIGGSSIIAARTVKVMNPFLFESLGFLLSVILLPLVAFSAGEKLEYKQLAKNASLVFKIGFLRNFIGGMLIILGFSLTSGIKAVFLLALEPAIVSIVGTFFLKKKMGGVQAILIALMFTGAFLLSTGGEFNALSSLHAGDALIVAGLMFITITYFPSQKLMKKMNSFTMTMATNAVGGALLLPAAFLFFSDPFKGFSDNWAYVAVYSTLFMTLSLFFFFRALETTEPWIVSSLLQLASPIGAVIAFLWLGETLAPLQLTGAAVILIASYFIIRKPALRKKRY